MRDPSERQPESRDRVVVSGWGTVCAGGMNSGELMKSLRAGVDCSREVDFFPVEGCHCVRACVLPDPELREFRSRNPRYAKRDRVSAMLACAAFEALEMAGPGFVPEAGVFGTTSGAMSRGEKYFESLGVCPPAGPSRAERKAMVRDYLPQQAAIELLGELACDFPPVIVSNACASGTNAIGMAFQMLRSGCAGAVICGGYDALSQLVFAGFEALRALSPDRCRPFDKNRSGLLLGEGAGVLCLELESRALARGARPVVALTGYGAATDNHHLTQPDPSGAGPYESMQNALRVAGVGPAEVDYVNAHGTATLFNDASEGRALHELLPSARVSSTKGLTGHTLGAAGAIEGVICCMALDGGWLPGNINLIEPDPELPLRLVSPRGISLQPGVVLSNSLGFGGSNASVVFQKLEGVR